MALPEASNGLRKKVETLTTNHTALVQELNKVLTEVNRQISVVNEVVNALTKIIGDEEVRSVMEQGREEARKAAEDQQVKAVELLKSKDVLKPVEVVGDDSLVITSETYQNGKTTRQQFHMSEVQNPAAKTALLGKKPGEEFDLAGVKVMVKEVYFWDRDRAAAVQKEEQEKAAVAQQAAVDAATAAKSVEPTPTEGV